MYHIRKESQWEPTNLCTLSLMNILTRSSDCTWGNHIWITTFLCMFLINVSSCLMWCLTVAYNHFDMHAINSKHQQQNCNLKNYHITRQIYYCITSMQFNNKHKRKVKTWDCLLQKLLTLILDLSYFSWKYKYHGYML